MFSQYPQKLPQFRPMVTRFLSRPDRANDLLEENLFVRAWFELCFSKPDFLTRLLLEGGALKEGERPSERDQKVCASIIQWLGSKGGLLFMLEAKSLLGTGDPTLLPHAFALAWQHENIPQSHINRGYTAMELIMNEKAFDPYFAHRGNRRYPDKYLSPLEEHDFPVAEALVRWLGTTEGQRFVQQTEAMIKKGQAQQSRDYHLTWNLNIFAPT